MDELLGQLFSQQSIAAALAIMPDVKTKVMDDVYPENMRSLHSFAQISLQELTEIARAVPVVRRGSQSVNIGGASGSINFIEPQPIDTVYHVSAKELNDLKMLSSDGHEVWVQNKIEYGRRILRATADALSCQSLTGTISYPMKIDGGFDIYTISFGTVPAVTPTKMWNSTGATIGDVNDTLNKMTETIEDNGFGIQVEFRCGAAVENFLVNLISTLSNDTRIAAKVGEDYIQIGKHKIKMLKARYWNPQTNTNVNAIGDNEIQAIDMGTDRAFKYMAIDNLNAELAALPIFVNPVRDPMGKGYSLNFMSTPFPIPRVKAMAKATVLS